VLLQHDGDALTHGAVVDLGLAGPQDSGNGLDTFLAIEALVGTGLDDRLTGDGAANILIGGAGGDDTLLGGAGDDYLQADYDTVGGGAGRDFLRVLLHDVNVHANHDPVVVSGGGGIDVLSIDDGGSGRGVRLRLSLTGPQNAYVATVTVSGVEVVSAGFGEDLIVGDDRDNTFYGGMLADTLKGAGGDDILFGDLELTAPGVSASGYGVDALFGGQGDDTLFGGAQSDTLDGGAGRDVFRYLLVTDSMGEGIGQPFGKDVITHLRADDVIDLSALDADGFSDNGNQAFHLVDAFTSAPGELRIVYDAATDRTWLLTDLKYDNPGSAAHFFQIVAAGDHTAFAGLEL
jgi:Ca2+-binding RTX toxin-like protein